MFTLEALNTLLSFKALLTLTIAICGMLIVIDHCPNLVIKSILMNIDNLNKHMVISRCVLTADDNSFYSCILSIIANVRCLLLLKSSMANGI